MKRISFSITVGLFRDVSEQEIRTEWGTVWERDIFNALKSMAYDPIRVKVVIPKRKK